MKKNLHYCLYGATEANEKRHAQAVMRDLGITYEDCTPQSIADCWQFWNCENIPEILPKFITEMKHGPLKYIGHGLTEEMAKQLDEHSK